MIEVVLLLLIRIKCVLVPGKMPCHVRKIGAVHRYMVIRMLPLSERPVHCKSCCNGSPAEKLILPEVSEKMSLKPDNRLFHQIVFRQIINLQREANLLRKPVLFQCFEEVKHEIVGTFLDRNHVGIGIDKKILLHLIVKTDHPQCIGTQVFFKSYQPVSAGLVIVQQRLICGIVVNDYYVLIASFLETCYQKLKGCEPVIVVYDYRYPQVIGMMRTEKVLPHIPECSLKVVKMIFHRIGSPEFPSSVFLNVFQSGLF